MKTVLVAMSGGVDSSTAAALLKEQGYKVVGASMQLWDYSKSDDTDSAREGSCCSLEDLNDARRVADAIGIPFYVLNMEKAFSSEVVDYFVRSYLSGETPNPCTKCNEVMKFRVLLDKAVSIGADYLATGHYAQIVPPEPGNGAAYKLLKGRDENKDQSYFLFTMTQPELSKTLFPLGTLTKEEVRTQARRLGLRIAEKKESQEICFIEDDDYGEFISSLDTMPPTGALTGGARSGDIVDAAGAVLGTHNGLYRYTVGQRRGLNLNNGPHYVLSMDMEDNRLVVGPETELYSKGLVARELNWISGAKPDASEPVVVKIRYRHEGAAATLCFLEGEEDGLVAVDFNEAQRAVTPGQAVVFYRDNEVLGGGWIERPLR